MKVITVTLNPSLDRTLVLHYMNLGYHNRTTETTRLDPAGRGINISRALHQLGCDTRGLILLGDDATGRAYRALISLEGFPVTIRTKSGGTRSNVTLLDTGHKTETHLIEESRGGTNKDLKTVANALKSVIKAGDLVVLAGSLPGDAPTDTYFKLTKIARKAGAIVVLAARGSESINQGVKAEPDVIILHRNEMEVLFNHPVRTPPDVVYCARKLCESGIQQVLVTMMGDHVDPAAILVTHENVWQVDAAETEDDEGTRAGTDDALLAGFLTAWTMNYPSKKALELGAAAALYTATKLGNEFGTLEEIESHLQEAYVATIQV